MPTIPTGGLSLFINITILVVGFIFKSLKKVGISSSYISTLYSILTDKNHDSVSRRILGYGLTASIFVLMSSTTSFSIYNRMTHDSNIEMVRENVERVIAVYRSLKEGDDLMDEIEDRKSKVNNAEALAAR